MKVNQKGSINIIPIIIVVALVGAGAYFVSTRQITPPTSSPTPSPTTSPSPTPTPTPKPSPTLTPTSTSVPDSKKLDFSQFEKICAYNERYRNYECQRPISEFHCGYFLKPSEYFAWLEPMLPIMICKKSEISGKVSQEGVYRVQGVGWAWNTVYVTDYVVFQNGEFKLISSTDEFKNVFASVQTREEALAFVGALNRGNLVFDTQPLMNLEGGKYKVSKLIINKTSASETNEGFIVNAYTDFGTCSDTIYRKNLLVKTSGEIEEKDSILIWESDRKPRCIY